MRNTVRTISVIAATVLLAALAAAIPLGQGKGEYIPPEGIQFHDGQTMTGPGAGGEDADCRASTGAIAASVTSLAAQAVDGSTSVIAGLVTALASQAVDGSTSVIAGRLTLVAAATPTFVITGAPQIIYGTGKADVTGQAFALVSGGVYEFEFYTIVATTAAADGYGLTLTGPATTFVQYVREFMIVNTNSTDSFSSRVLGALAGDAAVGSTTVGVNHVARIRGIIIPSANGTLQLQAWGELSTTKLTVQQYSWATCRRWQ